MTTRFEFRLIGLTSDADDGELDADHLIAIVAGLRDVAHKIARAETKSERRGRAPARVHRVSRLTIGLAPGSTRVLARRSGDGSLDLNLADEQGFDSRFTDLIDAIAEDHRPDWVDPSLARSAGDLVRALRRAAPEVEFSADGRRRRRFATDATREETWRAAAGPSTDTVTFVGQLFAANLHSHYFRVQDDVGHRVALPDVADDEAVAGLLGSYVEAVGRPEMDPAGRITHLHEARLSAAADPVSGSGIPVPVSLPAALAVLPGLEPGRLEGITDDEADSFFAAMGL